MQPPRLLKIYSHRVFLNPGQRYQSLLYPFWGIDQPDPTHRFDTFIKTGPTYIQLTDNLKACDLAVWPGEATDQTPHLKDFMALAKKAQKPTLAFCFSDYEGLIVTPFSYVFRTSFNKRNRQTREYSVPAWCEDFSKTYHITLRNKQSQPVVGYCGYVNSRGDQFQTFLGLKKISLGMQLRTQAVHILNQSTLITTNFILRSGFWGKQRGNSSSQAQLRKEFVDNIKGSDYTLCVRGGGNFSYRFYETLSAGRIPVFIDTECVLPYENEIDWKSLMIRVDSSNLESLPAMVHNSHKPLSKNDFAIWQSRCYQTWKQWLSPEGFYQNLWKIIC